ncbi:hypothetical protein JCM33374_g994 [Metschnikowia sp. JCM 33374]|nr:hypothetical protein JCM33374_g994 [Metschnikowia sp. JCM 33374]
MDGDHFFARRMSDNEDNAQGGAQGAPGRAPAGPRGHDDGDDNESDSTLCSELEDRRAVEELQHEPLPFGVPNSFVGGVPGILPPEMITVRNLLGLQGRHPMAYNDPDDFLDEMDDFYDDDYHDYDDDDYDDDDDDYANEEVVGFFNPTTVSSYTDYDMQLGALKLIPAKDHKHILPAFFECEYKFDVTNELIIIDAFGGPKHEPLVPFKLENASSFAEWYHYFKTGYSRTSPLNEAYCRADKYVFLSFFDGEHLSGFENGYLLSKVDEAFSQTFKKCLGKNLQKKYANRNLSRELVELMFVRELEEKAKPGLIKKRHAELYDSPSPVTILNMFTSLKPTSSQMMRFTISFDRVDNLCSFLRDKGLLKSPEIPTYDVEDILKKKPEYKNYVKKKGKSKKKKKKSNSDDDDICLKFHPEAGTVDVPLHGVDSCREALRR